MLNYKNLKVLYLDDIYAYMDLYKNDILNYLNDEGIDPQPNNIKDCAYMLLDSDHDYILSIANDFDNNNSYDYILVCACLGLWYGKRKANAKFKTLKEALQHGSYDTNIIYFKNDKETLIKESAHHDGTNTYKYYFVKHGKKYAINFNRLMGL